MITKKWIIHATEWSSLTGFIKNVHWRYAITDSEDGKEYYADTYSVLSFEEKEEPENFIQLEEIVDEKTVIGWVIDSLGKEKIEEMELALLDQIEKQKNPVTLSGLPWLNLNKEQNEKISTK
jgi:hypothetical protein